MTTFALWAAIAGAAVTCGICLLVAGLYGTDAPRTPRLSARRRWRRVLAAKRGRRIAIAIVAGLAMWAISGWPVAGIVTALAIPGLPYFFSASRKAEATIDRLQGLAEWVRRLADAMAAGGAPVQTIVASAPHAPAAITESVGRLAAGLGSPRADRHKALLRFAADINDPLGDMVTVALDIATTSPSARVPDILRTLAGQLADDVTARRRIETDRAEPRSEARTIVIVEIIFVTIVCAATSYASAYGSAVGQLVLALLALVVIGALWMLRRLSADDRPPRLLATPEPATAAPVTRRSPIRVRS